MDELLHDPSAGRRRSPHRVVSAGAATAQPRRSWQERLCRAAVVGQKRYNTFRRKLFEAREWFAYKTAGQKLINPLGFWSLASVLGIAVLLSTVYTPSFVVTVNGTTLGTVRNQQVFEEVESRVEDRATAILGYEYEINNTVTYDFALTDRENITPISGFETYLFDQIGEVMKSYVLTVNGNFIGAAADQAALDGLLNTLKAPYVTENTTATEFVEDVRITREYTPSDIMQDLGAMQTALTANTNGETAYEIQKGDTFMAIAFANDMSMAELQELNPDVNIDRLYIGQLLTVRETIPYLSVKTTESVTYHEPIACPVEEVTDDSMYQGDRKTVTQGVEGEALISADVMYVNGKERERSINETTVLAQPTTTVVAVGTMPRPKTMPTGSFIWPVYGHITSYFGYRSIFGSYSYHSGLDISTSRGTAIGAADGGTVVFSGWGSGSNWSYGKLVIIDHGNGRQTYYAHCDSLLVSAGTKVYQGQTIARVGSTGRSTGSHCHFEVKLGGTSVNPLSYLP